MSNGNVKLANKRYTTIPHDHCLVFDTYSNITEINEEKARKSIIGNMYNFTSLEQVSESQLFIIDVIGVITSAEPVSQILLKSGEYRDKRTVNLADETGFGCMATFWGEVASHQGIKEGEIVAIKGAKLSDYGGKSLNVSSENTIELSPTGQKKYDVIKSWYEQGKEIKQLTQIGENLAPSNF